MGQRISKHTGFCLDGGEKPSHLVIFLFAPIAFICPQLQMMQAMGMRPVIIWIVWMAVYVCNTAVLCILITGALKLTGLLPVSNIFLIFITLFNFGISLTAYRYTSFRVPTMNNSPIYDEHQSQLAKVLVLSREHAHQDDPNNTLQPKCEFFLFRFPSLWIGIG